MKRRHFLAAASLPVWAGLSGCGTPLPLTQRPLGTDAPGADAGARAAGAARLRESAQLHGLDAFAQIRDINVSYDGQWRPLIDRIQPVVVDKTFRGSSQERLMPAAGVVAQAYSGPAGRKQVLWQRGRPKAAAGATGPDRDIGVWFNEVAATDEGQLAAAALVADCYGFFLLGPLWAMQRGRAAQLDGTQRVDGRLCDVVQVWLEPGLGRSTLDRATLFIDRDDHIARRLRFTLEGYANTQGAVAEVDTFDHARRFGVLWPRRSYEEVVHPLRLPAHDWHITGLDVNRGYGLEALQGPRFTGAAAADAQPWPAG